MKRLIVILLFILSYFSPVQADILYDGVDDYVTGSDTFLPANGRARSFTCWLRLDDTPGSYYTIFVYGTAVANESFYLLVDSDRKLLWGAHGSIADGVSDTALTVGVWYNVGIEFDGSTTGTYYLNGVADGTGDDTIDTNLNVVQFGSTLGDALQFKGQLGDAAIWSSSLTAPDFAKVNASETYRMTTQVQRSTLAESWPFNDHSDGTSGDGLTYVGRVLGNNLTGTDGANDAGLTNKASEVLSYP